MGGRGRGARDTTKGGEGGERDVDGDALLSEQGSGETKSKGVNDVEDHATERATLSTTFVDRDGLGRISQGEPRTIVHRSKEVSNIVNHTYLGQGTPSCVNIVGDISGSVCRKADRLEKFDLSAKG